MDIDKRLMLVLQEIDFANRYKLLCEKHSDFDNRLVKYDKTIINEIYARNGLKTDYVVSENFFKTIENVGDFTIHFHSIPYNGFIQFLFSVRLGEEKVSIGLGVWESITRKLLNLKVKKPLFTSIEELEEILSEAISIYEDFKKGLLASQA